MLEKCRNKLEKGKIKRVIFMDLSKPYLIITYQFLRNFFTNNERLSQKSQKINVNNNFIEWGKSFYKRSSSFHFTVY